MDSERLPAKVEVFAGLEEGELRELMEIGFREEHDQGGKIFSEGQWAEDFFVVIEGRVDLRFELSTKAVWEEATVSAILPGGSFGWSALTPPYRYTLSAYSVERECRLLRFKSRDLINLFEQAPRLGYIFMRNVARVIGRRFNDLEDQMLRREVGIPIRI
ncbi:MAG: cyclic nucleotide-binding domain-containing protein [Pseudomonadota bacterium]